MGVTQEFSSSKPIGGTRGKAGERSRSRCSLASEGGGEAFLLPRESCGGRGKGYTAKSRNRAGYLTRSLGSLSERTAHEKRSGQTPLGHLKCMGEKLGSNRRDDDRSENDQRLELAGALLRGLRARAKIEGGISASALIDGGTRSSAKMGFKRSNSITHS